jgi:hypothetical protein
MQQLLNVVAIVFLKPLAGILNAIIEVLGSLLKHLETIL